MGGRSVPTHTPNFLFTQICEDSPATNLRWARTSSYNLGQEPIVL